MKTVLYGTVTTFLLQDRNPLIKEKTKDDMMKKIILAIVILSYNNNLYARKGRPEELFREPSDFAIIVGVIVLIILSSLFIYTWIEQSARGEKEKDTNSVGCLGIFGIIGAIILIMSKCS